MFGFNKDGYLHKRFADIVDEMRIAWEAKGYGWKVDGGFAVVLTIAAFAISKLWENLQALYGYFVEDNAIGIQLDNNFSQVDLYRIPASRSTVFVLIAATEGTTIAAATEVSVDGTGELFRSGSEGVIVGVTGFALIEFESVNYGRIEAATGTINTLVTANPAIASVSNSTDAFLGRDVEKDDEFKARKKRGAFNRGLGTIAALESDIRGLAGVTDVRVFENSEPYDDPISGRIANSVEAVVVGGVQADVVEKIFKHVDGGIRTSTTAEPSEQVFDSHTNDGGLVFPVNFSRGLEVKVLIIITVTSRVAISQIEKDLIRDYVVGIGQTQKLGDAVREYFIESAVNRDTIFDEDNVVSRSLSMGKETAPGIYTVGVGDIVIAANEIAIFDTSRITINAVSI